MTQSRKPAAFVLLVALGVGCSNLLGIDKNYEEVAEPSSGGTAGSSGEAGKLGASGSDGSGGSFGSGGGLGSGGSSGQAGGGSSGQAGGGSAGEAGGGGSGGADSAAGTAGAGTGGAAGSDAGGGSAGGGAGGTSPCPTATTLVSTAGGAEYCIDRYEVTNAAYAAFLTANVPVSGQPAVCAGNMSFEPAQRWPFLPVLANHPVVFVDWCDAAAYCAWAGKRLCGKVGGGSNPPNAGANAAASEWFNSCSRQGAREFPYGNAWAAVCNDSWAPGANTIDVGSMTACEGGFPSLFDFCGNVWEWESSCSAETGQTDRCLARGASFQSGPTSLLRCSNTNESVARSTTRDDIGIRCCADRL